MRSHPIAAAAAIGLVDALLFHTHLPWVVNGALDEPAHLATAILVLAAVVTPRKRFLTAALLSSVLIDLDHIPLYAGLLTVIPHATRPFTHSLATVIIAAGISRFADPGARQVLVGIACGVLVHLFRDLATGSVSLFWPLSVKELRMPYGAYALVVIGAAMIVKWRASHEGGEPS